MRSCCGIVVVLLCACGPGTVPSTGTGDGSGSSDAASAGMTTATSSGATTAPVATTSGATTMGSSTSGSMADSTGVAPTLEYEGLLEYCSDCFNRHTYFHPCGDASSVCLSGNVHELWMCSGAYAHIRGHFEENPSTFIDAPCGAELFHVDEVVEARLCEPSDCGGTTCDAVDCENSCFSNESCPEGYKCAPWMPADDVFNGTRCMPVGETPGSVGEPCTRSDGALGDSCDAESLCIGVDPRTSVGECAPLCSSWMEDCPGDEQCVLSGGLEVSFCRPPCNPLDPACGPGQQCVVRGSFVCMDDADVAALPGHACRDGGECSSDELCLPTASLPACGRDACCTPLCDTTAPVCPPGLLCTSLELGPPAIYENLGVCSQ